MTGKRTSSGRSAQIETELDVDEPARKKARQSTDNTQRIRPVASIPRRRAPLSPFRSHQTHGVGGRSQSKKGKERRRSCTPDEFASGESYIDVRSKNWSKNRDTAPEDLNTEEEDENESSDDNDPQDSRSARGKRLVTKSSYYVEPVSAHQSSHQSTFQIVFHPPTPGHNQSSKPKTKSTDHGALIERADARDKGIRRVTEEMRGMEERINRNIEALRDIIKGVVESSQEHLDRAETKRSERDERARRGGQRGTPPQPPASTAARRQQGYTAKTEPGPPSLTRHRARASSPFQPNISSPPRRSCSSDQTIPYPGSRDKVTVTLIRKLLGLGGRRHHRAWFDIRRTLRQVLDVSGFDLTVPYMVQAQSKRVKIIKEIEDAIPEFKRFEESWGSEHLARLTFQARRAGWERKNNTWSDEDGDTD